MIGTVVDDRYEVQTLVGSGAMAHVLRAHDRRFDRTVAMKVMAPGMLGEADLVTRFQREFKVCAGIHHPHVIELYSLGRLESGAWYYTMEFLPHPSLADLLLREGPLSEERTLRLAMQAASALAHVHAQGIIHRDLKPGNLMVRPGDDLVIVDFGLVHDAALTALTATGTVMGTPAYMAPEVALGDRADGRSDLYALGVVTYECLTGRTPYVGDDVTSLFAAVLHTTHRPLRQVRPDLTADWDAVVGSLLAKDRSERTPDAAVLLDDLAACGRQAGLPLPLLPPLPPPSSATAPSGAAPSGAAPSGATAPTAPTAPAPPIRRPPPRPATRPVRRPSSAVLRPSLPPASAAAPPRRGLRLPALVATLVLALAGLAFLMRPSPAPTAIIGLVGTPLPGAVAVTWTSDRPVPTQLRVLAPRPDLLPRVPSEPTTSHRVVVGPLTPDSPCTVVVVKPDGTTSLPLTSRAGTARLDDLRVLPAPGGHALSFLAPGASSVTLTMHRDGDGAGPFPLPAQPDGNGRWTVTLPPAAPSLTGGTLTLDVEGSGPHDLDLGKALVGRCLEVGRSLADLDPSALVAAVSPIAPAPTGSDAGDSTRSDDRHRTMGERLTRAVSSRGCLSATQALAPFLPLVFETRLVPLADRLVLYRSLVKLPRLAVWAQAQKVEPPFVVPFPAPLGDLGLSDAPTPGADRQVVLHHAGDEPFLVGPPTPHLLATPRRPILRLTFSLADADRLRRAELVLGLTHFRYFSLTVNVNGRAALLAVDLPFLAHSDETPYRLALRIPPEALQAGPNALEISADLPFDRLLATSTDLRSVILHLWYPR